MIEIRTVLEKIRPIDHKLRYQIDKLVKTAITGTTNANDPLKYKANPDNLVSQFDDSEDGSSSDDNSDEAKGNEIRKKKKSLKKSEHDGDGEEIIAKYVPPKMTSMPYDDEESLAQKHRERAKKRALSSALVDEWKEEFLDTPVEIKGSSIFQQMVTKKMKERERYEEDNFTRLPMTKEERHRQKRLSTMGSLGDELAGFSGSLNNSKKRKGGASKKKSGKRRKFH